MKPFDLIGIISSSKTYDWSEETETAYTPFLVNRNFSLYYDTCMLSREMNTMGASKLSKKMQHDFFFYGIKVKKKRFAAWSKPKKDENILLISSYYKCNKTLAEQYEKLLSEDDLENMRNSMFKGGQK